MNSLLSGKIIETKFDKGFTYSKIIQAASDSYTQPSVFDVRSTESIGNEGQEVTVFVVIQGYIKRKPYKDSATGEPKVFHEQKVYFNASIPTASQLKTAA